MDKLSYSVSAFVKNIGLMIADIAVAHSELKIQSHGICHFRSQCLRHLWFISAVADVQTFIE